MGVTTLRSPGQFDTDSIRNGSPDEGRSGFARGVLVNVLNPKVALFFLAFLPPFVDPSGSTTPQLLALGGTYAGLTLCYLGCVALLAGTIGRVLATKPAVERGLRGLTGSVLVVLGLELAPGEHRPG